MIMSLVLVLLFDVSTCLKTREMHRILACALIMPNYHYYHISSILILSLGRSADVPWMSPIDNRNSNDSGDFIIMTEVDISGDNSEI